jgi:hypothetical protein
LLRRSRIALDQMLPLGAAFVGSVFRDRRSPDQSTKLAVLSSVLACDSLTGDRGKAHRLDGSREAVPVSTRNSDPGGVGLTQIGELSFILVQVARSNGLVSGACYSATLAASLLSIFGEHRTGSGRSAGTAGDFYLFITEITPPLFRFEWA